MTDALVSTDWLAAHIDDPKVVVLDGTYHLPTAKRDADAEFPDGHIPGAQRFDIDKVCDPDDPLPHMIPSAETFAQAASALGIDGDTMIVAYDVYGMQSSARTWWMFRLFGHDKVAVLDGGMPKWQAEGRPMETGPAKARSATDFEARFRPDLVKSRDEVLAAVKAGDMQIVDARPAGRFTGDDAEPRPGMRSGHIPGSRSLPVTELVNRDTKTALDSDAVAAKFKAAGLDPSKPTISSCGSGVTACMIALNAHRLGHPGMAVYDGSWSDWGSREDTPVETGPADAQ